MAGGDASFDPPPATRRALPEEHEDGDGGSFLIGSPGRSRMSPRSSSRRWMRGFTMRRAALLAVSLTLGLIGGATAQSPAAFVYSLSPTSAHSLGGAKITLQGDALNGTSSGYSCSFTCGSGSVNSPSVVIQSSQQVMVVTVPSWEGPPCTANVIPAYFGAPLGSLPFTFTSAWNSLGLAAGPSSGGTTTAVNGAGFNSASTYTCEFSDQAGAITPRVVPAFYLTPVRVTCTSPAWPVAGTAQLRVLQDGAPVRLVGPSSINFRFTAEGWTTGSPQQAFTDSGGNLTVYGAGFDTASRGYYAVFAYAGFRERGGCAVLSQQSLTCTLPIWTHGDASAQVEVFSGTGVVGKSQGPFIFVFVSRWTRLEGAGAGRL
ncbi:hypothetical protein T484DRAFT_1658038, partial [Baffinella frigidus]